MNLKWLLTNINIKEIKKMVGNLLCCHCSSRLNLFVFRELLCCHCFCRLISMFTPIVHGIFPLWYLNFYFYFAWSLNFIFFNLFSPSKLWWFGFMFWIFIFLCMLVYIGYGKNYFNSSLKISILKKIQLYGSIS
jgi:hypothetical protein